MSNKVVAIVIFCLSWCLTSHVSSASEEKARDFIEHILSVPNADNVLNTVLWRLERNRHQAMLAKERVSEEADCEEPTKQLPEYTETLQNTQSRELRQLGPEKHYAICHLERKIRRLNTDEYEYRPAYYEEVRCTSNTMEDIGTSNEICSSLGFACVQWNKTIHLTRRRYSSDCWEMRTMVIPAGCECMWPAYRLGDISFHDV